MDRQKADKQKFSGYRVAFGLAIVIFCHIGGTYTCSVLLPFFLNKFQCSLTAMSVATSLGTLLGFAVALFSGAFIEKVGARRTLMIATCVAAVSFLLRAFTPSLGLFYVAQIIYGFVNTYGAQVTCAVLINRWFVEKRGLVIGIVFGMAAIGGSVFMFLAGHMIDIYGQAATHLFLLALLVVPCLLSELFLIKESPEKLGEHPLGWEKAERQDAPPDKKQDGVVMEQARKSASFYLLIAGAFIGSLLLTIFSSFAPTYWITGGISQSAASTYASALTLLGGVVAALAGGIADKWGLKMFTVFILVSYGIGLVFAILWGTVLPGTMSLLLMVIFLSTGTSTQSIGSTMTLPVFGPRDSDRINGVVTSFNYAGCAAAGVLGGVIYDAAGSFIPLFFLMLALTAVGLVCMLAALRLAPYRGTEL